MGVLTNIKNVITNSVEEKVAEKSRLAEAQLKEIAEKRSQLYKQHPNMNSKQQQGLITRRLGAIGIEAYQAYLSFISEKYDPVPMFTEFNTTRRLRYFEITKWVTDVNENYIGKLANVYQTLYGEECNIALIYNRKMNGCRVYLAVVNNGKNGTPSDSDSYRERLYKAVSANFPGAGIVIDKLYGGTPECISDFNKKGDLSIAAVTSVPGKQSESFNGQGIEMLLDGIAPQNTEQEYTIVLLAEPINNSFESKRRLSDLYTSLTPFASWQTSFSAADAESSSLAFTAGLNLSHGDVVQFGKNHSTTQGINASLNIGIDNSGDPRSDTNGTSANGNFGVNFSRSSTVSVSLGNGESLTQSFTNQNISHTLEILDEQMKRLEQCTACGMWKFASYVISNDDNTTNDVAHMYLSLSQGESSCITQPAINFWNLRRNSDDVRTVFNALSRLQHPQFILKKDSNNFDLLYPTAVDAASDISGHELAYALDLPKRSVCGLPVIKCASFGRNVQTYDIQQKNSSAINLGSIYHMHKTESSSVALELDSLCSNTLISGSSGSGKSNTIFGILDQASKNNVNFLVIEPAKGEYKKFLGGRKDVSVYGTNPAASELLKINPFSFRKGIHILEHIDMLVELFCACWQMNASMPAVLKKAVEKAYEDCGWDLRSSHNELDDSLYPTFADAAANLRSIIDSGEYVPESMGALLTRLDSLTCGLNGMIFAVNEISSADLFDGNVIVDLSRTVSSETRSLIMGMLILKLREYRMTLDETSSSLRHITVLEEAHNILKRTPAGHVSESESITCNGVGTLTNAVSEMRSYGEGFIIADSSPSLIDAAAIRNTNTKILLCLADIGDRELVGRSAALSDAQIAELAKLPCGVAAVYQNEWIEPVLCKVNKFESAPKEYAYSPKEEKAAPNQDKTRLRIAQLLSKGNSLKRQQLLLDICPNLRSIGVSDRIIIRVCRLLLEPPSAPSITKLAPIMSELFPRVKDAVEQAYATDPDPKVWTERAETALKTYVTDKIDDTMRRDIIQAVITDHLLFELKDKDVLKKWWREGGYIK